jgi:outer membrane protein assembly factor BamD (BamD/ComL family)
MPQESEKRMNTTPMKTRTFRIAVFAVPLAVVALLTSCSDPASDLQKAEQTNTEQAFTQFIKKHPDSPLLAQAQAGLEKAVYQTAKQTGTSRAFESFLNRFPKSPLARQAKVDLENTEYEQARHAGTGAAYEAFLGRFPAGDHAPKAKTELESIEYVQAKQTGTVPAYEAFLGRFPVGEHAAQAKVELDDAEFVAAGKHSSISAWQAFLKQYPQSPHAGVATSNLCSLSFKDASAQNTVVALDAFLKEFSGSQYAPDALERLAPLVWKEVSVTNSVPAYESFFGRFGSTSAARQAASAVVRKALYGDLPGGPTLDVTDKVRALVLNGAMSVAASESNFGDPFKGNLKLTITRAEVRVPGINLGGDGGAGDITDTIKGFQTGNTLHTTSSGDAMKVTVYYDYGDGKRRSTQTRDDGTLSITPPTKLRVDYTFNGVDMSKTVEYDHTLRLNDKGE